MATKLSAHDTARLRAVRLGARATLTLGIGASLAANVLAADPSIAGRVIAAWSPIALLLTVELLSRVPITPGWLSRMRVAAATVIAGIAAWVSYWHMVEVAETFGEAPVAAHVLPFSVDGLVVVASICLVEISDRLGGARSEAGPRTRSTTPHRGSAPTPAATANGRSPSSATTSRSGANGSTPTGDRVRAVAADHPDWTQAQIAEAAGCSIRTVRRHLTTDRPPPPATPPTSTSSSTAVDGAEPRPAAAESTHDQEVAA